MEILVLCIAALAIFCVVMVFYPGSNEEYFLGGSLNQKIQQNIISAENNSSNQKPSPVTFYDNEMGSNNEEDSRFFRPSTGKQVANPYSYRKLKGNHEFPVFDTPKDVLYAYFGVLREASLSEVETEGGGMIGDAQAPYPLAYELFDSQRQLSMNLWDFKNSFLGVHHINLLRVEEAYTPKQLGQFVKTYFFEIETIEGCKEDNCPFYEDQGVFAYYYGIASIMKEGNIGYRIVDLVFVPENWLCAPYHGWRYDAKHIVQIVFENNVHLISKITAYEEEDGLIRITGSGKQGTYRFEFVRLTNGFDVLIRQFHWKNDEWQEDNYLPDEWYYLFLTREILHSKK